MDFDLNDPCLLGVLGLSQFRARAWTIPATVTKICAMEVVVTVGMVMEVVTVEMAMVYCRQPMVHRSEAFNVSATVERLHVAVGKTYASTKKPKQATLSSSLPMDAVRREVGCRR